MSVRGVFTHPFLPTTKPMPMHRGTVDIAYQHRELDPQGHETKKRYTVTKPAIIRGKVAIISNIEANRLVAYYEPKGLFMFGLPRKYFMPCLKEIETGLSNLTLEDIENQTPEFTEWQCHAAAVINQYRNRELFEDEDRC